jgi:hypothetical protein
LVELDEDLEVPFGDDVVDHVLDRRLVAGRPGGARRDLAELVGVRDVLQLLHVSGDAVHGEGGAQVARVDRGQATACSSKSG